MGNRLRANDRVFHTIDTVATFRSIVCKGRGEYQMFQIGPIGVDRDLYLEHNNKGHGINSWIVFLW